MGKKKKDCMMRGLLRRLRPSTPAAVLPTRNGADIPDVPLEKFGLTLPVQATVYNDLYNKHTTLVNLPGKRPQISSESFVAPSATLVGNVEVWDRASVWYDCVINSDTKLIRKQHAYEFYLPGHAYIDAEKKGIQVGFQVEPLSGEESVLLAPNYKEKVSVH